MHSPLQQPINQPVIKPSTICGDGAPAIWHKPWPGDREPIGANAKVFNERHVFIEAVDVITRRVTRAAINNRTWNFGEAVPNRLASRLAVAFDLPRACRHTEDKISRERTPKGDGRDVAHLIEPSEQKSSVCGQLTARSLCYCGTKFNTGPDACARESVDHNRHRRSKHPRQSLRSQVSRPRGHSEKRTHVPPTVKALPA